MSEDANILRQQRIFSDQLELVLRETNREVIHGRIPKLDKATFTRMAHAVAEARMKYLAAGIQLAGDVPLSQAQFDQLKQLRSNYEEARAAFDSTTRAVTRGYIDLAE